LLGGERQALGLRGRYGHQLAESLAKESFQSSSALSRRLREEVLSSHAYSAELFKASLLRAACTAPAVDIGADPLDKRVFRPARRVDLGSACDALHAWSNTGNSRDRGSLLWDAFWSRLEKIPQTEFYRVAFSPESPLETPKDPAADDPRIAQALGAAILSLADKGWALNAERGTQLVAHTGGREIALYGGCSNGGYFTVACNDGGSYIMDGNTLANTYLQIVRFTEKGVEAFTLLAHGQTDTAVANGAGGDGVQRYARKDWLRMPFNEEEIASDPALTRVVLEYGR